MNSLKRIVGRKLLTRSSSSLRKITIRTFSNDNLNSEQQREYLLDIVQREIKEEENLLNEKGGEQLEDGEVDETLKQAGWEILDKGNCKSFQLKKRCGDVLIEVHSDAHNNINEDGNYNDEDKEGEEDNSEEENEDSSEFHEFHVVLSRKNNNKKLVAEYISFDGEFHLQNFYFTENVEESLSNKKSQILNKEYSGPQFEQLDEELQGNFITYLESFGLNEEFFGLVLDKSIAYEEKLYRHWLGDLKTFLE